MTCRAATYVAYRREDAEQVDALVDALEKELGTPPEWCKDWFFIDRHKDGTGINTGEAWVYTLMDAHLNAVTVLGIMSESSMPKSNRDMLKHSTYIEELLTAQTSGRLQPVILGDQQFELPMGLNLSQSVLWDGYGADTIRVLANAIRNAASQRPKTQESQTRRNRWLSTIRQAGKIHDQRWTIELADLPLVFRHIVDVKTGTDAFVTVWPVSINNRTALSQREVDLVLDSAEQAGISLRLFFIDELTDIVVAPTGASLDWRNPFDLAIDMTGPPIWTIDDSQRNLAIVSPYGARLNQKTHAALWLTLKQ